MILAALAVAKINVNEILKVAIVLVVNNVCGRSIKFHIRSREALSEDKALQQARCSSDGREHSRYGVSGIPERVKLGVY